jgi:hypothetical protein
MACGRINGKLDCSDSKIEIYFDLEEIFKIINLYLKTEKSTLAQMNLVITISVCATPSSGGAPTTRPFPLFAGLI